MRPRVGVFGIGLRAYWDQFEGLREQLDGYRASVELLAAEAGADVVAAGLVDTAQAARATGDRLRAEGVDLVLCHVGTYATSSQVLPVLQRANAPAVILNLQPSAALDYENATTADWLAECSACCVPEIANAMGRARLPFRSVSGMLTPTAGPAGARAWTQITGWIDAARAARAVRDARIGILGHTYPGMLDLYTDLTQVHAQLGTHVEILEVDDLVRHVEAATDDDVERMRTRLLATFDIAEPANDPIADTIADDDLAWAARVGAALENLVAEFDIDALSYYHRGANNEAERAIAGAIAGLSMLTASGIACSGEGDIKNAIAMLLVDRLGAGGSFTEFYAMDFDDDIVLLGHDGPAHLGITQGRPVLRKLSTFHGKVGFGVSIEAQVRPGPVTIVGLTEGEGGFRLLVAEGTAEEGPTLSIGNTNTRVRFSLEPAAFVDTWCAHGPTHHVALGTGHIASTVAKTADILGVSVTRVA